jgi:hypothetical protein
MLKSCNPADFETLKFSYLATAWSSCEAACGEDGLIRRMVLCVSESPEGWSCSSESISLCEEWIGSGPPPNIQTCSVHCQYGPPLPPPTVLLPLPPPAVLLPLPPPSRNVHSVKMISIIVAITTLVCFCTLAVIQCTIFCLRWLFKPKTSDDLALTNVNSG